MVNYGEHWYGANHGEFIAESLEIGKDVTGIFAIPQGDQADVVWCSRGTISHIDVDLYYSVRGPATQLPRK
jgi:hypothetical protein